STASRPTVAPGSTVMDWGASVSVIALSTCSGTAQPPNSRASAKRLGNKRLGNRCVGTGAQSATSRGVERVRHHIRRPAGQCYDGSSTGGSSAGGSRRGGRSGSFGGSLRGGRSG